MVCSDVAVNHPPAEGVTRDDLGSRDFYEPLLPYGRAKSANAIYGKELSRRLAQRGVSVNSFDSGPIRDARLNGRRGWIRRLIDPIARLFTQSDAQRAATAALLAASPQVAGISGEYWSNCQITHANARLADEILAKRLWETSEQIVSAIRTANRIAFQAAAQDEGLAGRPSLVGAAD
jgi:WW domain-containing oxidoreductase